VPGEAVGLLDEIFAIEYGTNWYGRTWDGKASSRRLSECLQVHLRIAFDPTHALLFAMRQTIPALP